MQYTMATQHYSTSPINSTLDLPEIDHLINICTLLPLNPKILEIGTFLGKTSAWIADARRDADITTLDIFTSGQWEYDNIKNVDHLRGYLDNYFNGKMWNETMVREYLSYWNNIKVVKCDWPLEWNDDQPFDLIFEDSAKAFISTSISFPICIQLLKPGGYLACHDSDYEGVKKSLDEIVQPHSEMEFHSKYKQLSVWRKYK